jgi:hypothetical protein
MVSAMATPLLGNIGWRQSEAQQARLQSGETLLEISKHPNCRPIAEGLSFGNRGDELGHHDAERLDPGSTAPE